MTNVTAWDLPHLSNSKIKQLARELANTTGERVGIKGKTIFIKS